MCLFRISYVNLGHLCVAIDVVDDACHTNANISKVVSRSTELPAPEAFHEQYLLPPVPFTLNCVVTSQS